MSAQPDPRYKLARTICVHPTFFDLVVLLYLTYLLTCLHAVY